MRFHSTLFTVSDAKPCAKSVSGKNQKNMASYKFWQTQPVPRFGVFPEEETDFIVAKRQGRRNNGERGRTDQIDRP